MSNLNNQDFDRFLKNETKQILLASGAFKLAPDWRLIETGNDSEDLDEEN